MEKLRKRLVTLVREQQMPIAKACRLIGMSRQTAHEWLRRYDADPVNGLADRSRRPLHFPTRIPDNVRCVVRDLYRQTKLSARRLRRELAQSFQIVISV